jgi:hypothetical protein
MHALCMGNHLHFDGPFPLGTTNLRDAVIESNRVMPSTLPFLKQQGVVSFWWLLPQENCVEKTVLSPHKLSLAAAVRMTSQQHWSPKYGVDYKPLNDGCKKCARCQKSFSVMRGKHRCK